MPGVEGKIAFITGGGSGIGRATAVALAHKGANLAVCDLNLPGAEETAHLIAGNGQRAIALQADVSRLDDVQAAVSKAQQEFSRIDILYNNAGIGDQVPFVEITEEQWDRMFAVHVGGAYNCTRAVLPGLLERNWGRIISTSSMGALMGGGRLVHYCAAKAGIIGFTISMASELARTGITVNAVAPGVIDTPMLQQSSERWREAVIKATPTRRAGKPEDIAYAVAFLAAEEASFITGQVLSPNGGAYMVWT
jgi:NAD(P)-dependent dehydrogenase (short-subunit alcohol dehydrogenase family)